MSIQEFEKLLEAVEIPNLADYSEDQELSCILKTPDS